MQFVNLGGTNKIVLGKPADGVGTVVDRAAIISHAKVGVMVFLVRNPGYRVDESNSLVIVRELKAAFDGAVFIATLPLWVQLFQKCIAAICVQWLYTTLTGSTSFLAE